MRRKTRLGPVHHKGKQGCPCSCRKVVLGLMVCTFLLYIIFLGVYYGAPSSFIKTKDATSQLRSPRQSVKQTNNRKPSSDVAAASKEESNSKKASVQPKKTAKNPLEESKKIIETDSEIPDSVEMVPGDTISTTSTNRATLFASDHVVSKDYENGHVSENEKILIFDSRTEMLIKHTGPRANLPPSVKSDVSFQYQSNDPLLLPPEISGKCGDKAIMAPAHIPSWGDPTAPLSAPERWPSWCLSKPASPRGSKTPVYLAAHIYVRFYIDDKSQLTKTDLAHWLTYYRYAGFERVYIYDCWLYPWERVENFPPVQEALTSGFAVYVDWHTGAAANFDYRKQKQIKQHMYMVQYPASEDAMAKFGAETRWMSFMDVDEYPFQENDREPGFFSRFLVHREQKEHSRQKSDSCSMTTQHKLRNYLCKGGREYDDPDNKTMLMQQVPRRTKISPNQLGKQIVRMDARSKFEVHSSRVKFGRSSFVDEASTTLKMMHFQGGRQTNWQTVAELQTDSPALYEQLMESTLPIDMNPIPQRILLCFDSTVASTWPTLEDERDAFMSSHPGEIYEG